MRNYWAPDRVLQSRNPYLQTQGSRNPKIFISLVSHLPRILSILKFLISPQFCFKIPNLEIQMREIPNHEKPIEDHQIKPNIICYLALLVDCVLH